MPLPRTQFNKKTVQLSGGEVEVRGLSRSEALSMADYGEDVAGLEKALIAASTDESRDEVEAWYDKASSDDVQAIVDAVLALSGLDGALGKGSPTA